MQKEGGRMKGECFLTPTTKKQKNNKKNLCHHLISLHKFSGKIPDRQEATEEKEVVFFVDYTGQYLIIHNNMNLKNGCVKTVLVLYKVSY